MGFFSDLKTKIDLWMAERRTVTGKERAPFMMSAFHMAAMDTNVSSDLQFDPSMSKEMLDTLQDAKKNVNSLKTSVFGGGSSKGSKSKEKVEKIEIAKPRTQNVTYKAPEGREER